jgi:hypothetical protein
MQASLVADGEAQIQIKIEELQPSKNPCARVERWGVPTKMMSILTIASRTPGPQAIIDSQRMSHEA